ncbi:hypothetical protein [Nocardia cyriacigeorgica]|uniref:hypothetical protein n=1 Tax=Nocardia cyriacigeorgica TaxID=135487 RepID=UPI002456FA52|nr:hypothetical protein [Nocardia cyriacigeorgica]
MPHTTDPEAVTGTVTVAGRRTPMVLSVMRCLREGLERGDRVSAGSTPRTVSLHSATDAQRAHVTFTGSDVVVTADATDDAEVTWQVRWSDPVPAETGDDVFAKEVEQLLSGRVTEWRAAAEEFWRRAGAFPGLPTGLHIYCADDDSVVVLGEPGPDGQGLFGTAAALTSFFQGRSTLLEVLESGEFGVNVSFTAFSSLLGANLQVVCGER